MSGEPGNWLSSRHLSKTRHKESMSPVFLQLLVKVLVMHTRIPQERRLSNPATDDELIKRGLPMLRIEKESDGHTTTLRLIGRIQSANIGDIQAQMDDGHVRLFMDLGEVTLVDVEVVRFLSECEDGGIVLVHCPPYVREWILRERAEGA